MVNAISSIENLDVNDRIQAKVVTPINSTQNDESKNTDAKVKSLNLEDYTYGKNTPKPSNKKTTNKDPQTKTNPQAGIEIETTSQDPAVKTHQTAEDADPNVVKESTYIPERTMGARAGGMLSDSNLDQVSLSDTQLLLGDIAKSGKLDENISKVSSNVKLKTIVINVKDDNDGTTVKKITVDNTGHIVKQETVSTSKNQAKQRQMEEDKRNIDNLVTNFQQKREGVENLMLQLKSSIANGDVEKTHNLVSSVQSSISVLRTDAATLYNKIALYEGNVYDEIHVNNKSETGNEHASNSKTSDRSVQINQEDQQLIDTRVNFSDNNKRTLEGKVADINETDKNPLLNQPVSLDTGALPKQLETSLEKHEQTHANNNKDATNPENSANTTAYVENISLTNQVAASLSLTANTGALDLVHTNHNAHRSHVGMHHDSPVDLDMAVEESEESGTDNRGSSNSDRHDNRETYQQQDMDYGYNTTAMNAYGKFNNQNNEQFREKQRKVNELRYEKSSTNDDIDVMEDQLNRLTSESKRVENEEAFISKAPTGMRDQLKKEAVSRREQRLSFM